MLTMIFATALQRGVSAVCVDKNDAYITYCMLSLILRGCRLCQWQILVLLGCVYCASAYRQRIMHNKKDVIRFADMPAASVFACVSG